MNFVKNEVALVMNEDALVCAAPKMLDNNAPWLCPEPEKPAPERSIEEPDCRDTNRRKKRTASSARETSSLEGGWVIAEQP